MASLGNTGDIGLIAGEIAELNSKPIPKICCDVCRTKPGTHWFGLTSAVTCGSAECVSAMQKDFDAATEEQNENDY